MIKREIIERIRDKIGKGKAIVLFGARQVGKTTLLKELFGDNAKALWLNGDIARDRDLLSDLTPESFQILLGQNKVVIIDEAQRIPDIGIKLKIIQDYFGDKIQLVATGSSSFELANKINEPMTGRKWVFWLPTLTFKELANNTSPLAEKNSLEARLIFGSYPEVVTHPDEAEEVIDGLASDDLYKDILNLGEIIKTDKLSKILKALAYQIGSQVSINEIANLVELDNKTVDKYIALLEQSFIIFRLSSYSKNLRNELKTSQKFYFYDVGIRNALIGDYRPLIQRQDIGNLFENYIIAELKKQNQRPSYFWRTTNGQEVDYLTEYNTEMTAIEIKWNEKKSAGLPSDFIEAYRPKHVYNINRENYAEILMSLA